MLHRLLPLGGNEKQLGRQQDQSGPQIPAMQRHKGDPSGVPIHTPSGPLAAVPDGVELAPSATLIPASTLYSALPRAFRTQIPQIPSIRRTVGEYALPASRRKGALPYPEWPNGVDLAGRSSASAGSQIHAAEQSATPSTSWISLGRDSTLGRIMGVDGTANDRWKYANQGKFPRFRQV